MFPRVGTPKHLANIQLYSWLRIGLLFTFVLSPLRSRGRQNGEPPVEEKLLSIMNAARSGEGVASLTHDKRLDDAASLHAAEFVKNVRIEDQFEGEPSLVERLRLTNTPSASAGEIMLTAVDLDHVSDQLMSESTKRVMLDPKFSAAGFAVIPNGKLLFIVVNLVQPFQSLSMDEVEDSLTKAVQRNRMSNGLPTFKVLKMKYLRGIACDMAKKDSLSAKTVNLNEADLYTGSKTTIVYHFTFTSVDPQTLPGNILNVKIDPKANTMSLGACYGSSPTYPGGVYWVYVTFYGT